MVSDGDIREKYNPDEEIPDWFWQVIDNFHSNHSVFQGLTDGRLIEFANEMLDLKDYFFNYPFNDPEVVEVGENTLHHAGAWVISQGRDFFNHVWDNPDIFISITRNEKFKEGICLEFTAHREWKNRHGTLNIPTI